MQITLLGPAARSHVGPLWRRLEQEAGPVPLACRWAWTATWLESYAAVVEHRFALAHDGPEVIGIALVTRDVVHAGPLRVRRLHIGTAGEPSGTSVHVQRNDLLTAPGRAADVAAALVRCLRSDGGWDVLHLDGALPSMVDAFGRDDRRLIVRHEACWVTELQQARHDVRELVSAGTRSNLRRALRRTGEVSVRWATGRSDALTMLEELIVLHQRRWRDAGHPGVFSASRFTAFHRRLVTRLADTGEVWLARASAGGELLSSFYGFMEGGRMQCYQCGRAPSVDPRVPTGLLGEVAVMGAARARGVDLYDMLAGDADHKRRLATRREELAWVQLRRGYARWAVHDAARSARNGLGEILR